MQLLHIGTIFTKNEKNFLIIGYSVIKKDEKLLPAYKCVRLPLGFISKDSIKTVSIDDVDNVIFSGYKNEQANDYLEKLGKIYDVFGEYGEEVNDQLDEVLQALKEGGYINE